MLQFKTLAEILNVAALLGEPEPKVAATLHRVYGSWMDNFKKQSEESQLTLHHGYTTDPKLFANCLGGWIHVPKTVEDLQRTKDQFAQYNFTEMDVVFDDEVAYHTDVKGKAVFCLYQGSAGNFLMYVPMHIAEADQLFMVTLKETQIANQAS